MWPYSGWLVFARLRFLILPMTLASTQPWIMRIKQPKVSSSPPDPSTRTQTASYHPQETRRLRQRRPNRCTSAPSRAAGGTATSGSPSLTLAKKAVVHSRNAT